MHRGGGGMGCLQECQYFLNVVVRYGASAIEELESSDYGVW